ncbi:MAG: undecaprenyl-phosphate glucose phosphotransferase [Pseudomonadota bacterium]
MSAAQVPTPHSLPAGESSAKAATPRVQIGEGPPLALVLIERLDIAAVIVSLFACLLVFDETFSLGYLVVGVLAVALCSKFLSPPDLRGILNYGAVPSRLVARTMLEWSAVCGVLLLVGFSLKVSDAFSRSVMLSWFGSSAALLIVMQEVQVQLARWLNRRGVVASRHVIVGAGNAGTELARRLPAAAFHGYFDYRSPERLADVAIRGELIGRCAELGEFVRREGISIVYITLPISNSPRIRDLLADLRNTTATVYFVPDVFGFDLIQARVVDLNGLPALAICDTPLRGMNAWSKRMLDIILAGIGVAVLAPALLVIGLLVRATSPGPALFKQRRYGLHGDEIVVYKFRSMTVREDGAEVRQASANDQRVTPIGRFLRRTSIDELPQLLNVLEGGMSLVGPRPHAVAHNELYRRRINGYMVRHKVRPGITGWAQVHGLRGETDTLDKMEQRVRYDLEYLSNWSLALDVKILFKTVFVVLGHRNAY